MKARRLQLMKLMRLSISKCTSIWAMARSETCSQIQIPLKLIGGIWNGKLLSILLRSGIGDVSGCDLVTLLGLAGDVLGFGK